MKKIILIISVFMIVIIQNYDKNKELVIIPNNSIRFRIISSSNNINDIFIKETIKNKLEKNIKNIESESIEETKINIKNNIPIIENDINQILKKLNYKNNFKINYGKNYFPEKKYNGVKYKAGNYESLVITLGKGDGENFWCVLFPPLCLIEYNKKENIEYKFLVKEIIDKYK